MQAGLSFQKDFLIPTVYIDRIRLLSQVLGELLTRRTGIKDAGFGEFLRTLFATMFGWNDDLSAPDYSFSAPLFAISPWTQLTVNWNIEFVEEIKHCKVMSHTSSVERF